MNYDGEQFHLAVERWCNSKTAERATSSPETSPWELSKVHYVTSNILQKVEEYRIWKKASPMAQINQIAKQRCIKSTTLSQKVRISGQVIHTILRFLESLDYPGLWTIVVLVLNFIQPLKLKVPKDLKNLKDVILPDLIKQIREPDQFKSEDVFDILCTVFHDTIVESSIKRYEVEEVGLPERVSYLVNSIIDMGASNAVCQSASFNTKPHITTDKTLHPFHSTRPRRSRVIMPPLMPPIDRAFYPLILPQITSRSEAIMPEKRSQCV